MKTKQILTTFALLVLFSSLTQAASLGTAFTYQGRLTDGANPAQGIYDLRFTIYDAATNGNVVSGVLTNAATPITNGLFTVTLDFGGGVFDGSARWLEIAARTNGAASFTPLAPRQALTPSPYAVYSPNAGSAAMAATAASVPASGIGAGTANINITGTAAMATTALTSATATNLINAVSFLGAPDGSPANALMVDTNGNIGIGTGAPEAGLQISTGAAVTVATVLFQEQDGIYSLTNLAGASFSAVSGNLLAISADNDSAVTLLDITDPYYPMWFSQIRNGTGSFTNLAGADGLAWAGSNLVVAAYSANAVTIMSATNPTSPVKLAELRDGVNGWNELAGVMDVAVSGNLLAMAAYNDAAVTLADISNPSAPVLRGYMKDGSNGFTNLLGAQSVALSGNLLAIGAFDDSAVTLVDVTDPANPQKLAELRNNVGAYTNLSSVSRVALSGNLLAIAAWDSHAVTLVDVSNPSSPVKLAELRNGVDGYVLGFPQMATLSGNRLAVGSWSYNTVTLVDVSDPAHPVRLATATDGINGAFLLNGPMGAAFAGTNLVVCGYNDNAFTVLGFQTQQAGLVSAGWVGIGTTRPVAPLNVVGSVVVENADSFYVDTARMEVGRGATASGGSSIAMGVNATASGNFSTAIGFYTTASGYNSTAMGESTLASSLDSTALGYYTTASGNSSTAMGNGTTAGGMSSTAMGDSTSASGNYSTALGKNTTASGENSTAMGYGTTASDYSSTAIGASTTASGYYSTAMGFDTTASGTYSTAMGGYTVATNSFSTAMGGETIASGNSSTAMGNNTAAGGNYSLAAGHRAKALHNGTFVWGDYTEADFASSGLNQFLIRASGGVGINKTNPATALDVNGTVTATSFSGSFTGSHAGNGGNLTNLNASQLASGSVPLTQLSGITSNQLDATTWQLATNLNGGKAALASNVVAGITITNAFITNSVFAGNGGSLTNLNASQLTSGTVTDARLSGTYSSALTLNNAGNSFTGNGAGLTSLNASSLASGTVPLAQLSGITSNQLDAMTWQLATNLNGGKAALASNVVAGIAITNAFITNSVFAGNGGSLTNLNASQLVSGTVSDARLSANVATLNSSPTFTGTMTSGGDLLANRLQIGSGHILTGNYATIAGGQYNTNLEDFATISGGQRNTIGVSDFYSTIGGGFGNTIQPNANYSTIGGGQINSIGTNSYTSTIGGGYNNNIQSNANYSTIGGGAGNTIQTNAIRSTVGGGFWNTIGGGAQYATVPGGYYNTAGGNYSFAAGNRAKANDDGTFVWADSQNADFASTTSNQFLIRASGGVGINKANPATALDVNGTITATNFSGNGGSLSNLNASQLAGTVPLAQLSGITSNQLDATTWQLATNLNGGKAALASNVVAGITITNAFITNSVFAGNGGSLTNLNASQLASGTVPDARLSGTYSGALTLNNAGNSFTGNGGGLTNLNATQLASGTVSDARLSANVATLNSSPTFAGTVTSGGDLLADRLQIGFGHLLTDTNSTIAGGYYNTNLASNCAIGGGRRNTIQTGASYSTISGGYWNTIQTNADYSAIGGGYNNTIQEDAVFASISGGYVNSIHTNADYSAIGGGYDNNIAADARSSVIGGGSNNIIRLNAYNSVISGGDNNDIGTNANRSVISGGYDNNIAAYAAGSFIGGGRLNDIGTNAYQSAIGGGYNNNIDANANRSVIAGGEANNISTNADHSVIAGGYDNNIAAFSSYSLIAGGRLNDIGTDADHSVIGGGSSNNIADNAYLSVIAGGYENLIDTNSALDVIAGGYGNYIGNNAQYATIPGGYWNTAMANYSFAAGTYAETLHDGSFVIADYHETVFASTAANQFRARFYGGYQLYSSAGAGVQLASGGGSWTSLSDRNAKESFEPVNTQAVLDKVAAMPLTTWKYKSQDASIRHIGPMAQDFKAAFAVGESDTGITTIDADGVALAAIQGLNRKLNEKDAEIQALKRRLEALEQRLTK